MKHILTLTLLCFLLSNVHAQKQEISITYSPLSIYSLEKIADGTESYESNYHVLGAINFDYLYSLNNWFKIGFNIMYDRASKEGIWAYYTLENINDPTFKTKTSKQAFVISPEFDFQYLNHPKFKLSSSLLIGYAMESYKEEGYYNSDYNLDGVTYHINLIGFKWGQKQGLTGQLGLGYKGLINLGYFARF
nr:hypothetical protein [uncultured Carboxylicivirga sp.]